MLADRATDPYRTLTAGTPPEVQLVTINGYPIYRHAGVDDGAAAVDREPIQVSPRLEGGSPLRDTASRPRISSGSTASKRLEVARTNPAPAPTAALRSDGPLMQLTPDKYHEDPTELQKPETAGVTVRPLDSLRHHAACFATAVRKTLHVARLEALSTNFPS